MNQLNNDDTSTENSINIGDNESVSGDINNTNISYYDDWINIVEYIVYSELNLALRDLPDENYRVNYDVGVYPDHMAKIVISNFKNCV